MKIKLAFCVCCLALFFNIATVFGQEENNWRFELAPLYLWAINIEGDSGVRGRTASTKVDFSEIYESLEGVFTVRFNAFYRQKFGMLIDYNYLDLGSEKQTDIVDLDAGTTSQILNLAGTYRIIDGMHTLDCVAGIRYNTLELEVDLIGTDLSLEEDQDWTDPIVGVRYAYQLADKWALRLYGDIGGFGVASDFTWQGIGLIDFQPWKHVAIIAGYRAIGTDYESGSDSNNFTYDVTVHGPFIGLDIRF